MFQYCWSIYIACCKALLNIVCNYILKGFVTIALHFVGKTIAKFWVGNSVLQFVES